LLGVFFESIAYARFFADFLLVVFFAALRLTVFFAVDFLAAFLFFAAIGILELATTDIVDPLVRKIL